RQAKVSLKQTQFYEQAVQTQVIAGVANMYYTLLMLDRQLQITEGTVEILKKNLETVQAMKDAGIYGTTSAAVEQSRTAYAQVMASLPDIRQSIRETENALCLMLHQPAQSIARGVLEEQQLPTEFSVGIPLQLLSNRPDVKAAEMSLAASYYNTNSARAAFYPQITLSGSGGWTNNSGAGIVNPGKLLASAIGSLTQPLFYRGAACKISSQRHITITDALLGIDTGTQISVNSKRNIKQTAQLMQQAQNSSATEVLSIILHGMQYADYAHKNGLDENKYDILRMLARNVNSSAELIDRLSELSGIMAEHKDDPDSKFTLSTVHSSKGLEYDCVYLLDVIDNVLPCITKDKLNDKEDIKQYEEERRLFYVAVTRAR
ncbi:outer membrane protein oprM, partial [human gut metagenome]